MKNCCGEIGKNLVLNIGIKIFAIAENVDNKCEVSAKTYKCKYLKIIRMFEKIDIERVLRMCSWIFSLTSSTSGRFIQFILMVQALFHIGIRTIIKKIHKNHLLLPNTFRLIVLFEIIL